MGDPNATSEQFGVNVSLIDGLTAGSAGQVGLNRRLRYQSWRFGHLARAGLLYAIPVHPASGFLF